MNVIAPRRTFLHAATLLPFSAAAGEWFGNAATSAEIKPVRRVGGARIKLALNAYSFSKLLKDHVKARGTGISLIPGKTGSRVKRGQNDFVKSF